MKFKGYFLSVLFISLVNSAIAEEHWSYNGKGAPQNWGDLRPDWAICKTGKNQSPIDIHEAIKGNLPKLEMFSVTNIKNIINNGHTIQINTKNSDGINIDGQSFTMEQFHFHTPSENLLNGNSYPIEMHFVHTNKEGQLAVVAAMATVGEANPTINKIINLSPKGINDVNRIEETLQLKTLLPKDTHYYRYSGSLTTPPCSEGVIWIVMKQSTKMSKEQIQELTTLLNSKNNRPPQPLNGRQVVEL